MLIRVFWFLGFTLIAWMAGAVFFLRGWSPQEPPIYSVLLSAAIQLAGIGIIRQTKQSAAIEGIAVCLGMMLAIQLSPEISSREDNSVAELFEWNRLNGSAITTVLMGGCVGFAISQLRRLHSPWPD